MSTQLFWQQHAPAGGRITTPSGHELAQYHWSQDQTHPFIHPLRHRAGDGVLTNFAPFDHTWHYGLWHSWKLINGVIFWENTDPPNQGSSDIVEHAVAERADGRVEIDQLLHLRPNAVPGSVWLVERRKLIARATVPGADIAGGWALDWELTWTAEVACELDVHPHLKDERWGGYVGLSYRAARAMAFEEQTLSSEGRTGGEHDMQQLDSCHAEPARWLAYSGKLDGLSTGSEDIGGVAILDHPDNARHPSPWYAWSAGPNKDGFGFLAPALVMHEPLRLKRDETLRLRYRVIPFAGRPQAKSLDAAWQAFSTV